LFWCGATPSGGTAGEEDFLLFFDFASINNKWKLSI